jgi:hypothetical protein
VEPGGQDTLEGGRDDQPGSTRTRRSLVPAVAVTVLALAVVGWLVQMSDDGRESPDPPRPTRIEQVLPSLVEPVQDLGFLDSFGYHLDQRCRCAVVRVPLQNPNSETVLVRSVHLSGAAVPGGQVEAEVLPTTVAEASMSDPRERPPLVAQRIALEPDGGQAALVVWLRPDCLHRLPAPRITVHFTIGAARHTQVLPPLPLDGHNRPALAGVVADTCAS